MTDTDVIETPLDMIRTVLKASVITSSFMDNVCKDIEMTSEFKRGFTNGNYAIGDQRKTLILKLNILTHSIAHSLCQLSVDVTEEAVSENLRSMYVCVEDLLTRYMVIQRKSKDLTADDYFQKMYEAANEMDESEFDTITDEIKLDEEE